MNPDSPTARGSSPDTTTTALLIRHAHTTAIGVRLSGRTDDVELSTVGLGQAERLGCALAATCRIAAVYTSPLMRARSTAAAVARCQSLDARTCEDLSEIDFGSWSGKCFAELEHDAAWHAFNTARATAVVPDGEHPRDVQHRIVRAIARLTAAHPSDTIALISHADVVRFALLYYDARSLDEYQTFEIDPASVSAVRLSPVRPQILYVNDTTFAAGR